MIVNIIIYIITLLLTGTIAVLYNDMAASVPFSIIVFITIMSLLYTAVVRLKFSFTDRIENMSFVRGTGSSIHYEIKNKSIFMFVHISAFFSCKNLLQKKPEISRYDFSVQPFYTRSIEFGLQLKHIGKYSVGLKNLRFYDLLGLFYLKSRNEIKQIVVLPRLISIGAINMKYDNVRINSLNLSTSRADDKENYSGVREYIPGDTLKDIHWKLTAHTSKYMSRVYDKSSDNGLTVYLDMRPPECGEEIKLDLYDCLAESALSVAVYGLRQLHRAELVYSRGESDSSFFVINHEDVDKMSEYFAQASFDAQSRIEKIIKRHFEEYGSFQNVIVCTANLSPDLVNELSEIKSLSRNPILIFAVEKTFHYSDKKQLLDYLVARGIEFHLVVTSEELGAQLEIPGVINGGLV